MRLRQLDASEGVILAQWMSHPVVWHLDTPQVWMPGEANAEEVEDLALVPVRRRPDARHRRRLRLWLLIVAYLNLETHDRASRERHQVIHHIVARLALQPV